MFRQAATVQFELVKTPRRACDLYNRIASMLHMIADRSELSRASQAVSGVGLVWQSATTPQSQSQDVHHCSDSDGDVLLCRLL